MKITSKTPRVFREMVKYGMVGAVATVVDVAIYNLSHYLMHNSPSTLWIAVSLGYGAGTVVGYVMNSRWTFRYDTTGKEVRKFGQFALVTGVGLALTLCIVLSLTHNYGLGKNKAKLAAVCLVFFWNFGANRLWTFRRKPQSSSQF